MRMLLNVRMPHEPFNTLVRQAYFTEQDGKRGGMLIVDVKDPSRAPSLSEPFFLHFNADCSFHIVMSPDDLKKAGLDELGKKWA